MADSARHEGYDDDTGLYAVEVVAHKGRPAVAVHRKVNGKAKKRTSREAQEAFDAALRSAQNIMETWALKGFTVKAWLVEGEFYDRATSWEVRTNLDGTIPQGAHFIKGKIVPVEARSEFDSDSLER